MQSFQERRAMGSAMGSFTTASTIPSTISWAHIRRAQEILGAPSYTEPNFPVAYVESAERSRRDTSPEHTSYTYLVVECRSGRRRR